MAYLAASKRKDSHNCKKGAWKARAALSFGGTLALVFVAGTAMFSVLSLGSTAQRFATSDTRFKVAIVDHKRLPVAVKSNLTSTRDDAAIEKVAEALFPLDQVRVTKTDKRIDATRNGSNQAVPVAADPSKGSMEIASAEGPSVRDLEQARAAKLALAGSLQRQKIEHARQERFPSVAIATIAPGPVEQLAYGPTPTTRQVMNPEDNPFDAILPGSNEAEAGVMLPDDDAPLPTFRPAPPLASTSLPSPVARLPDAGSGKPDAPAEQRKSIFSIFSSRPTLPPRGSKIAVYDIANSVVYMPNGEKLEAHSGRGPTRDGPQFANLAGRGPTPPNVYSLRMRESLFHGVEAVRMTPVGSGRMYGRNGFLTHSYLRRVPGDSAGCVAFSDYKRFLSAFKRGEVSKIIVVPSVGELSTYLAML